MNALPQPWSWETGAEAFVPGPTTALGDLFAHGLSRCPDRAAISDGKLEFSFRALDALAWRIAARLRALGTRPGDRVAVIATVPLTDNEAWQTMPAGSLWRFSAGAPRCTAATRPGPERKTAG